MRPGISFGFILFISTLILCSCGSDRMFEENQVIQDGNWKSSEKAVFNVPVKDTVQGYKFYIMVRNDLTYPYSNLYLFLNTVFPDGRVARDTVECKLADPDGKWLGTGMGSIKLNRFLFQRGFRFSHTGSYRFEFEQAMRMNELKGIRDIGIRIEKEND
jgi:gliding motility-associated lipoprotein GldH